jgi:hypothetical protein
VAVVEARVQVGGLVGLLVEQLAQVLHRGRRGE